MNKCLNCGKDIKIKSHHKGGVRKYCSKSCMAEHKHFIDYKYTICQYCGKSFKEKREQPNLFCSRSCSAKFTYAENAYKKSAKEFHDSELLEEYREALAKLEELRYRIEHEKVCATCGKIFMAANSKTLCCSPECSRARDNRRRDGRIYRNGEPDLSISLSRLYARDNGMCQICGAHLTFSDNYNSDEYPTIDHIMPLSRGGLHAWNNVQLACRRCNTMKGNKLIQYTPAE